MKIIYLVVYLLYLKIGFLINNFLKKKKIKKNKKNYNLIKDFKKKGYLVIENFISEENCNLLIKKIDKFYKINPNFVYEDKAGAEIRIFGAQRLGGDFKSYFSNNFIKQLGSEIYGGQLGNLMNMSNRIFAKNGNQGSGSGWHRDALNFQYKSILYLNKTHGANGPFQIIKDSEKNINIIKDTFKYSLSIKNNRFSDNQIQKIIKNEPDRLKTFKGKTGTLLIVNTSFIHRGKPLSSGVRYAMTNYYYPKHKVNIMKNYFKPFLNNNYDL